MNYWIFSLIIVGFIILTGILNIFGVLSPTQHMEKYTPDSVKEWLKPHGIFITVAGLGVVLSEVSMWKDFGFVYALIGGIILVVGCIMSVMISKKVLIKK